MSFLLDKKSKIRRSQRTKESRPTSSDQPHKADASPPCRPWPAHPARWRVGGARGVGYRNRTLYLFDFGNLNDIANAGIYLLSDAQEQDRGVYLHLFHGIHKHLEPERLLKVGKSAITLARAQQITRSMYQLTYALPQSGHVKTTLLRKADVDKDDKYRRIACDNAVAVLIDYIDKIISRIP